MLEGYLAECIRVRDVMAGVQDALDVIYRRWAQEILFAGLEGARRFGEYRRLIDGISDRMLAQRLHELEALGLMSRTVVPSTPVQVHHAPTRHVEHLFRAIEPLVEWGEEHMAKQQTRSAS